MNPHERYREVPPDLLGAACRADVALLDAAQLVDLSHWLGARFGATIPPVRVLSRVVAGAGGSRA